MTQLFKTTVASPIGDLLLAGDGRRLHRINLPGGKWPEPDAIDDDSIFDEVKVQLEEYWNGSRKDFDLDLFPQGTDFRMRVWSALLDIPYGKTVGYGELARKLGRPKAARAVGAACGANPLPIVIPCHRVIGASGTLTGFGGGLDMKQQLLALEGWKLDRKERG